MNRLFQVVSDITPSLRCLLLAPRLLLLGGLVAWPMVSEYRDQFLHLPLNPNIESTSVGVETMCAFSPILVSWHFSAGG